MSAPNSTEHPVEFPSPEQWKDNPRLSTGRSIQALLNATAAKATK